LQPIPICRTPHHGESCRPFLTILEKDVGARDGFCALLHQGKPAAPRRGRIYLTVSCAWLNVSKKKQLFAGVHWTFVAT
jgi:hypothetical protein